jgi:hypothetical protein
MLRDMKLPQALLIAIVFIGTLGGSYLFAREGLDPTPAVVLGSTVLAGLGFGQLVAQQQQIKEQTNGSNTAQLATIRHLAAMAAVSQPTPEMRELAAQLILTVNPAPVSGIPAVSSDTPH